MDNNKLVKLLQTFTKKEWRDFGRFVESPYFNTDRQCVELLEILKKEMARNDGAPPTRERLEQLFLKKSKKDAAQFNVKLSLLTRLAEQFVAQQNYESQDLYKKHLLLEGLFQRDLRGHFESVYKKNAKLHKSPEKVSPEFYRHKYLIEHDFFTYVISGKKWHVHENLQEINDTLDMAYILTKIDLFWAMAPFTKLYQKDYDFTSFEVLESMVQLPHFVDNPIVRLYYTAYQMMCSNETSYFRELIELLRIYGGMVKKMDLYNLYMLSTNYCIDKTVNGYVDYHHEIYRLYRQMEEADLFLYKEYIGIGMLKNVISGAVKIREFEWAEYIIEKYKDKIEPKIREDVYSYFSASLSFYQNDFEKTISYLSTVQSINSTFDVNIKFMLMKAYYEQDADYSYYTEQVFRSFKVFIKQSKVHSKQSKEGYINSANIINNLYRIKHKEGRITLESVLKKMEEYEVLIDKKWLTEKIEELQNRPARRARC